MRSDWAALYCGHQHLDVLLGTTCLFHSDTPEQRGTGRGGGGGGPRGAHRLESAMDDPPVFEAGNVLSMARGRVNPRGQ